MNVVFLSPNFPPNYYLFPVRLREEGVNALGVGDVPWEHLRPELQAALSDYVHVPDMNQYEGVLRALGLLTHRYGKIDGVDSNNEHWLSTEASLRRDFNIPGQLPQQLAVNRSKWQMKNVFASNEIPCGAGQRVSKKEDARRFAEGHRFPLIVKPDVGVGAGGTFRLDDIESLEALRGEDLEDVVIEEFLEGTLVSFDGLTDLSGEIIFCTSHVFNDGIMEVVATRGPMHYYSLREIPADLERLGRKTVKAFAIRGRFFHIEYFRLADESLRALEVNVRPPGGFTTDMMNYAADIDVYELWAKVVSGKDVAANNFERKYHAAHVSRRYHRSYLVPHEALLERFGQMLMAHRDMPQALSGAMGDYVYLIRSPHLDDLRKAIAEAEREVEG